MKFIKNNPVLIGFLMSLVSGEYWAFELSPTAHTVKDCLLTLLFGLPFIMVTMFPCGGAVILFWALMGWWDECEISRERS
jgi:hypothetical protein